jgi:hypothetical protein
MARAEQWCAANRGRRVASFGFRFRPMSPVLTGNIGQKINKGRSLMPRKPVPRVQRLSTSVR